MKKFKTVISLIVAAAMLCVIPATTGLQASAEEKKPEPVTYVLKYADHLDSWRYQVSDDGTWDEKGEYGELHYLKKNIKDGDLLVITDSPKPLNLKLSVSLNNVTFNHSCSAVITAKSVENVFVLKDSSAAVNGNVANAYVYDNANVNFNNNVTNLFLKKDTADDQTVHVVGTVSYVEFSDLERIISRYYSFAEDKFHTDKGTLKTKENYYSLTPPPAEAVPAANNQ